VQTVFITVFLQFIPGLSILIIDQSVNCSLNILIRQSGRSVSSVVAIVRHQQGRHVSDSIQSTKLISNKLRARQSQMLDLFIV